VQTPIPRRLTHSRYRFQANLNQLAVVLVLLITVLSKPAVASADTLADCRKALKSVVASLNKRSPAEFNRTIDSDRIIDTALSDLPLDYSFRKSFSVGLKRGLEHIGDRFLKLIPEGHRAKVIRLKQGKNAVLGLVRMDYGDSGWGYIDLWLAKDRHGTVRIIDWYNFASGEMYSSSVKKIAVLASPTPTLYGRVFDIVTGRKDDIRILNKYFAALAQQQYDQSYALFKSMDTVLKKNRIIGIVAVSSANLSGNDEYYKAALANLARYHGDDPTLAFLLVDHYFLAQNYDEAIRSLNSFQAYVGTQDAAIENLKANAFMMAGNNELAVSHASTGIRMEPDLESNYWTLFNLYSTSRQYAQAVRMGKQLEERFNYDFSPASLGKVQEYRLLTRSAAYRKWRATGH